MQGMQSGGTWKVVGPVSWIVTVLFFESNTPSKFSFTKLFTSEK
jgi:hypothetical protein